MVNKISLSASALLISFALATVDLPIDVTASSNSQQYRKLTCKAENLISISHTVPTTVEGVAAPLFDVEAVQLNADAITQLKKQDADADIFDFENTSPNTLERRGYFKECKTYEGDLLWPKKELWEVFDKLIGNSLIKTVPFGAVCYDDFGNYNANQCKYITDNWSTDSYIPTADPTAVNSLLYEGAHCVPKSIWPLGDGSCTLGGLPSYSVNATHVYQIQVAVNFARSLNLRLVIKNTGHDFAAKSMGGGSLSIWTHNLKNIQFFESYTQGSYKGPALKVGAGVQAYELYEAAHKHGVTAVGGEGQTVGVMGGYIQGGGHSPLSGFYGMAADHVLSVQMVTANGRFVTASETVNPDLFWAVCGGGGSTYGVVTSVTVKAQPKLEVSTMRLTIGPSSDTGIPKEKLWEGVRHFMSKFSEWGYDKGMYIYFLIIPTGNGDFMLQIAPWFAPKTSLEDFKSQTAEPLLAAWAELGIETEEPIYGHYDDFYDAWKDVFPLESWGSPNIRQGSRLFPKANFDDATKFNATFNAVKDTVDDGAMIIGFNVAPHHENGQNPDNAVNPAWRQTVFHGIVAGTWDSTASLDQMAAISTKVTNKWTASWRDVTPGSGAYMSESDYNEPNFSQSFWGSKYAKALQLKKKFDPNDVFYAHHAVGSENWKMSETMLDGLDAQASKLCRA
ncbi:hypothetical protein Cpir12675_001504 [Ceratocystis pirilliformis]|uniref:FAD-binding PCMH-type domain-containing protein n=1 Tax=Ceratocystis pirilliformis TaxID=259994 RepID=A0ABR3ZFA2_9PEZI